MGIVRTADGSGKLEVPEEGTHNEGRQARDVAYALPLRG